MRFSDKGGAVIAAILAATLPATALAQSAAPACLSNDEAEALVTYALPATIRALSAQCAKSLPATAALVQSGVVTAARYQVDADRVWPQASSAFDKASGLPVASVMGEKALKPLIEKTISGEVTRDLRPKDCARTDRLINILQPLPAKNMAMLVLLMFESGDPAMRARLPVTLCSAVPAPATGSISK